MSNVYPTETPNDIIESPVARKIVYRIVAILSLVITAINAGFGVVLAVNGDPLPLWLAVTNVVFPVVSAGLGYTAQRNTPTT